jgi:hypothetical protein
MPSSTSSSEAGAAPDGAAGGAAPSNDLRTALVMLAAVLGLPLLAGHVVGRAYTPQPLAVAPVSAEAKRRLVLFGNSRIEAGVDGAQLGAALHERGVDMDATAFTGGGWGALHYYQLAILNAPALRAGRDAVVIEVSQASLDDREASSRLGVIRPEAALPIAALPGLPVESRLDLLVGAAAGLYRYRSQVQNVVLAPRAERLASAAAAPLRWMGAEGPPAVAPRFELVLAPGRNFVIQEVRGDRAAFLAATRAKAEAAKPAQVGGVRLEALRRAVVLLRGRGIDVSLVEVPVSSWLSSRPALAGPEVRLRERLGALCAETGARLLVGWPPEITQDALYFDDEHLTSQATPLFSALLADRLSAARAAR